jgi:hypothetical protein
MSPMYLCVCKFAMIQMKVMKKILLVAATRFEILPTIDFLNQYRKNNIHDSV